MGAWHARPIPIGGGRDTRRVWAWRVTLSPNGAWFLRDLRTAFGGSKHSSIGREGGVHSLEFYTELKNVCVKL